MFPVQERLNKLTDCDHMKLCGDIIEQIKFLIDEVRGQRFVVNINVPTQVYRYRILIGYKLHSIIVCTYIQSAPQTLGGSPILSSGLRKRHHSGSDREKHKRMPKSSISNTSQQSDSNSNQCKFS